MHSCLRFSAFLVLLCAFGVACATIGMESTARAAPDSEVGELMAAGIQFRRQHQDASALDAFQRAYAIDKSPRTMAQIALAEQALGRWLDAERHLEQALKGESDPWIARNRALLREALDDVAHHLGQLDLEANVPGAELFLDDQPVGPLPLKGMHVVAGKAVLEIRAEGYSAVRFEVQVPGAGVLQERVELKPLQTPADGAAPAAPLPAAIAAEPQRTEGSVQRTTALVMLGGGGLLVLGGVAANVVREQALARFNDDGRCFYGTLTREQRCPQDKHDADTAGTIMAIGYAVGGVAVGASVVLLLTLPKPTRSTPIVSFRPLPAGGLASFETTF
jgi:hypothetical protein